VKIANWVKTADSAAFPFTSMPAYSALPLFLCLIHIRIWTLSLAIASTVVSFYMAKKGLSFLWLYSRLRGKLHGNRVSSRPIWHIRRFSFLFDPVREK